MKDAIKGITAIMLVLVAIVGGTYGIAWLGLSVYRTFGTEYESTRTDIYRENKSHVEGTIRDLRELQKEYITSEPEHQEAIRSLILHRANELDWDRLPQDIRNFLRDLEGEKNDSK